MLYMYFGHEWKPLNIIDCIRRRLVKDHLLQFALLPYSWKMAEYIRISK